MKKILELRGYRVVAEDALNWAMEPAKCESGVAQEPIILPRRGKLLAVDVMMDTLIKTKTDLHTYFALKEKAERQSELSFDQSDERSRIQ